MHPYYVGQVSNAFRVQSEKIQQLEKLVQELRNDVDLLKNNKSVSYGPINYHFEQLKIEKLEGTLNIGITPNEGNNLDEAMVNGQPIGSQDKGTASLKDKIQPQVMSYLQGRVPEQFSQLEQEKNLSIDKQYIQMVTQDLQNQMDGRIDEYLGQLPAAQEGRNNDEEAITSIVEQIKRDIDTAVRRHMELNILGRRDKDESADR